MKFVKKPIIIEAHNWDGTYKDWGIINKLFPKLKTKALRWKPEDDVVRKWEIETLEGSMTVNQGDWIIEGIKGEYYPCKPDIFNATYNPLKE